MLHAGVEGEAMLTEGATADSQASQEILEDGPRRGPDAGGLAESGSAQLKGRHFLAGACNGIQFPC